MQTQLKEKFLKFEIKFLNSNQSIRFDKYLKKFFEKDLKQSEIEKAIRKKFFKINGEFVESASLRVLKDDELLIDRFFYEHILSKDRINSDEIEKYIPPKNLLKIIQDSIIFEDENIIALNKPSGLCVQAGSKILHSLDRILHYINPEIRVVHRLDKKTTGVLIFAKNLEYAGKIAHEFQSYNSSLKKTYVLIAKFIDNVGQNQKSKDFLKNSEILIDEKLNTIKIGNEEIVVCDKKNGKKAITKFSLIQKFQTYYEIKANLLTGRKHQIRAHLASMGFVILGDQKYERFLKNEKSLCNKEVFKEIFLHAKNLEIPNLNIHIEAKEPEYFSKLKNS